MKYPVQAGAAPPPRGYDIGAPYTGYRRASLIFINIWNLDLSRLVSPNTEPADPAAHRQERGYCEASYYCIRTEFVSRHYGGKLDGADGGERPTGTFLCRL